MRDHLYVALLLLLLVVRSAEPIDGIGLLSRSCSFITLDGRTSDSADNVLVLLLAVLNRYCTYFVILAVHT